MNEVDVTEPVGDDGSVPGLSWASVFDPSVNIRALGEIQARGFRAASEVVDRFVRAAGPKADPPPQDVGQSSAEPAAPMPDADRVVRLWQRVIAQTITSLRDVAQPSGGDAAVDVQNRTSSGVVSLAATEPGTVTTEVWLHNAGAEDRGEIRLHCGDLMAHDGTVISSINVRFEPDAVPMVARSSRGVTVEVDVPGGINAGVYRGTLLAAGYPDLWLPLVVTVSSTGS